MMEIQKQLAYKNINLVQHILPRNCCSLVSFTIMFPIFSVNVGLFFIYFSFESYRIPFLLSFSIWFKVNLISLQTLPFTLQILPIEINAIDASYRPT